MVVFTQAGAPRAASPTRWLTLATILLGALGAVYLIEGFYRALVGVMPQDLARRWLEGAYVVRRINPLDVYAGLHAPEPDIGPAHPGGYPPWSTAIGLLIAPPIRQDLLRVYFAAVNAVALLITARYAARLGRRHGKSVMWLFVVSCMAVAANDVVLRNGQYGIIVNAMLAAMLDAFETRRGAQGGVWLALAALKPQTSAPFALLWLRRRGIVALAVAALAGALATAALCWWIRTPPGVLFSQVFGQAAAWDGGDSGLLRILLTLGVARSLAIPALAATAIGAGLALLFRFRDASASVQAAILCVVGRLWTYHRRYDDGMLIFLLLPLGVAALERPQRFAWAPYFAVGLTMWLPLREADQGPLVIVLKVSIWLGGLAWLLRRTASRSVGSGSPVAPLLG